MKQRVISAVIALIIVIPILLLGGYFFYAGVGVLAIIGFYEIISVREKKDKLPMFMKVGALIVYLCIALSSITSKGSFNIDYRLIVMLLLLCFIPLITIKKSKYDCEDAFFVFTTTLFLGMAFNFLIVVRNMSLHYFIYPLVITIMSDTFAHFFGTKIGKIKLCPTVSPNKTVEGMIGGTVFGTFLGAAYFLTFIAQNANIFLVIIMSLLLSLVGQFGDLVFSSIKRKYGVKDYGNIMPGHGGVLDRLDSIIFAILAFSYLVSFF